MTARGASSSSVVVTNPSARGTAPAAASVHVAGVQRTRNASHHSGPGINAGYNAPLPARCEGASATTLPANDYAAFVRDIAEQCKWTEKVVHSVLRCMQHSIDLYRSNKLVAFFDKIASLTPGTRMTASSCICIKANRYLLVFRCHFPRSFRRCPAHSYSI